MILVLGSDGHIGKSFMTLSQNRSSSIGVDNFYKRQLLADLDIDPLYPVKESFDQFVNVNKYTEISFLIRQLKPDTIIHLAENPSAPYSMANQGNAFGVINNNLFGTLSLIYAIKDYSPDTHLIKLGTMGEYGCPNVEIPEGWFDLVYKGRKDRLLFPKTPHSIYHLSKVFDSDALAFASRMWGLKVTDLNQGFVHSIGDYNDPSRFCYDDLFGTVLNRFMVQAIVGHPLTVYGKGGQTRGVLHIRDTVKCLDLAIENPPAPGEFRVINQLTEWKSINDYADLVYHAGKRLGLKVEVDHIPNPRIEKEEHFYEVEHTRLTEYGLEPHLLDVDMVCETMEFIEQFKDQIRTAQILPKVTWR